MNDITGILTQAKQAIQGPRGPRYVVVAGVLLFVLGCIGITIAGGLLQSAGAGTSGSVLAGFLSLIAVLALVAGVVILVAGVAMSLIRSRKAKPVTFAPSAVAPSIVAASVGSDTVATDSAQAFQPQPHPAAYTQPQPSHMLAIEQRREILQQEITRYIRQGYRVVSQTDTTAQLVRPKRFSCLWATLWLLVVGIGLLIYLFYYWSKRDDQIYIEVDAGGRVRTRR